MVSNKNDPMIQQLTHVCKRIVVWLRTLYCWTRLLPSQQIINGNSISNSSSSSSNVGHIGFSIYVNTDYTVDDVTDLIHQQSFLSQSNPRHNGMVVTPYGELQWQVVYCSMSTIERNMPHLLRTHSNTVVRIQAPIRPSRRLPIPINPGRNNPNQNHSQFQDVSQFAPKSAPATHYQQISYTERSQQRILEAAQQQRQQQQQQQQHLPIGKSYDPHRHHRPTLLQHRQSDVSNGTRYPQPSTQHISTANQHAQQQQHQHTQPHPPTLLRSQTTIGNPSSSPKKKTSTNDDKQPARVMSGLSLALLLASNAEEDGKDVRDVQTNAIKIETVGSDDKNVKSIFRSTNDDSDPTNVSDRLAAMNVQEEENEDAVGSYNARRAALHQMPPHLLQQGHLQQSTTSGNANGDGGNNTTSTTAAFGDYGYGYNNHIPWQKIHPSQSNPTLVQPHHTFNHSNSFGTRTMSSSPNNSLSTPISPMQPHFVTNHYSHTGQDASPMSGAFFLRSTPPTAGITTTTSATGGFGHLIPPRNRSDSINGKSITPPFQSRPLGFMQQEPPTMFLESTAYVAPTANSRFYDTSSEASGTTALKSSPEPVTSLDSLRCSPFLTSQKHASQLHSQPKSPAAATTSVHDRQSAMFSSLAAAAVSSVPPPSTTTTLGHGMESDYYTAPMMSLTPSYLLNETSSSLRRSLWSTPGTTSAVMPSSLAGLSGRHHYHSYGMNEHNNNDDDYSEEMPFALELPIPSILDRSTTAPSQQQQQQQSTFGSATTTSSSRNNVGASSTFGTSSSFATLAQKCSMPNQRLKMFDKPKNMGTSSSLNQTTIQDELSSEYVACTTTTTGTTTDDNTNPSNSISISFADQLQEFRTFGASLHSSSMLSPQQQQSISATRNSTFGGATTTNTIDDDHHHHHVLAGSGTSSTSTPISLKS
jgi:hypothetical protein